MSKSRRQNLRASLISSIRALFSDKHVVPGNQSARYIENLKQLIMANIGDPGDFGKLFAQWCLYQGSWNFITKCGKCYEGFYQNFEWRKLYTEFICTILQTYVHRLDIFSKEIISINTKRLNNIHVKHLYDYNGERKLMIILNFIWV